MEEKQGVEDHESKYKTKDMKLFLFIITLLLNVSVYIVFNTSFEYDFRQNVDLEEVNHIRDQLKLLLDKSNSDYDDIEYIYDQQLNVIVNLVSHKNFTKQSEVKKMIQNSFQSQIDRFYIPNMKHLVRLEFDSINSEQYLGKAYRQTNHQVIRESKINKVKESYQYIEKQLKYRKRKQKLVIMDILLNSEYETYILKGDSLYQNTQVQNFYMNIVDQELQNQSYIKELILNVLINVLKLNKVKKYKSKEQSIDQTFKQIQNVKMIQKLDHIFRYFIKYYDDVDQIIREDGFNNIRMCLEYARKIVNGQIESIDDYYDGSNDIVYELYQFPQDNKRGVYLTILLVINIPTIQLIKGLFNKKLRMEGKVKTE